jgi:hypothetical protein
MPSATGCGSEHTTARTTARYANCSSSCLACADVSSLSERTSHRLQSHALTLPVLCDGLGQRSPKSQRILSASWDYSIGLCSCGTTVKHCAALCTASGTSRALSTTRFISASRRHPGRPRRKASPPHTARTLRARARTHTHTTSARTHSLASVGGRSLHEDRAVLASSYHFSLRHKAAAVRRPKCRFAFRTTRPTFLRCR